MAYDLTAMQAPRAAGLLLKLLTWAVEAPLIGPPLARKLIRDAGMGRLQATPCDEPLSPIHAIFAEPAPPAPEGTLDPAAILRSGDAPASGFRFESAADFAAAYREGTLSPLDVAERILAATTTTDHIRPALRLFIAQNRDDVLRQAKESTERWRSGQALGPLDGVPVAVKDELDQMGYPTTVGTRFLAKGPVAEDATVVARLRAAGALLIGKTNMHEIGLGVTGINPHHGAARNPYGSDRAAGGSSGGSAATVAAGLAPIAVGADGGGSIRIPAAFCGVVGLKATSGRISEHGASPLCWTVGHVGPIGATVRDVAAAYAVMAGPDPHDAYSQYQPTPQLGDWENGDLTGFRLGVYQPWFDDADPAIVAACRRALDGLKTAGAEIVPIDIPELGLLSVVHTISIVSEMMSVHDRTVVERPHVFGYDVRISLALARHFPASDYVLAQRHRGRIFRQFREILRQVDVIVTPTTAITAPVIPADALATGESNLTQLDRIMRFIKAGNLTGLPALTVPAGYDPAGMPIGFHLMGRPWEEHVLLRLGRVVERATERQAPHVHYRLLKD